MVEIVKYQILLRQGEIFVEVLISVQKNISKGSNRKRKNLVWMVIRITDEGNVRLGNDLDVDLKITQMQNVQSHQNMMRNSER